MFRNKNFIVGFPKIASHIIDNEVGGGGQREVVRGDAVAV